MFVEIHQIEDLAPQRNYENCPACHSEPCTPGRNVYQSYGATLIECQDVGKGVKLFVTLARLKTRDHRGRFLGVWHVYQNYGDTLQTLSERV